MAKTPVELAREVLDLLSRRDMASLLELADPDVEWHSFFAALGQGGGVYRGHDGTRQYIADLQEAWEIARADIDDSLSVGDLAVLVGRLHYRGKGSGVESEIAAGWIMRFRNERITYFRAFRDPELVLGSRVTNREL